MLWGTKVNWADNSIKFDKFVKQEAKSEILRVTKWITQTPIKQHIK